MEDEIILNKLRTFFEIASLKCHGCGKLGCLENNYNDGTRIIKKPEYYGIKTIDDWNDKMDEYQAWVVANKDEVIRMLPELENEWKETCKAVKALLK